MLFYIIGDCWFLAASASIAMYKDEFEALVPVDQDFGEKYCGKYKTTYRDYTLVFIQF